MYKNLARIRTSGSKVKGQGHQAQKPKRAAFCSGVVLWGAVLVRHFFREWSSGARLHVRRWENQRMLPSLKRAYVFNVRYFNAYRLTARLQHKLNGSTPLCTDWWR